MTPAPQHPNSCLTGVAGGRRPAGVSWVRRRWGAAILLHTCVVPSGCRCDGDHTPAGPETLAAWPFLREACPPLPAARGLVSLRGVRRRGAETVFLQRPRELLSPRSAPATPAAAFLAGLPRLPAPLPFTSVLRGGLLHTEPLVTALPSRQLEWNPSAPCRLQRVGSSGPRALRLWPGHFLPVASAVASVS